MKQPIDESWNTVLYSTLAGFVLAGLVAGVVL